MTTDAQRKARNKYNANNQITKTISFYKNTEGEIIEYINSLEIPFTTYVKQLIKKDIKENQ